MRKILVLIVISTVLGGAVGYGFSAREAEASLLDSILNFFRGAPSATSTIEAETQKKEEPKPVVLYKPTLDYEEAVTGAVEKAFPSVVSIVISKDVPIIENCPYDPFGGSGFRDLFGGGFGFELQRPCQTGTEKQEVGGGSGFIISEDGMIITNKHVVRDTEAEYTVFTNDGEKHDAKVLARDPIQDLAIIKINARGLKPAKLGDSSAIKLGQTAIAIGNALGEFRNTVSLGVISGLSRDITASGLDFVEKIEGLIQTDAAINEGNSGGPLLNLKGEVIGINTAMASGAQNIGFAIPINEAKRDIASVKTTGKISSPFLGIRYLPVTESLAKEQKLQDTYGALIRGTEEGPGVMPDSPAFKAGLLAEDVILDMGGKRITPEDTLNELIQKYSVGDRITLKVRRGKDIIELKATLGERPDL